MLSAFPSKTTEFEVDDDVSDDKEFLNVYFQPHERQQTAKEMFDIALSKIHPLLATLQVGEDEGSEKLLILSLRKYSEPAVDAILAKLRVQERVDGKMTFNYALQDKVYNFINEQY